MCNFTLSKISNLGFFLLLWSFLAPPRPLPLFWPPFFLWRPSSSSVSSSSVPLSSSVFFPAPPPRPPFFFFSPLLSRFYFQSTSSELRLVCQRISLASFTPSQVLFLIGSNFSMMIMTVAMIILMIMMTKMTKNHTSLFHPLSSPFS